MQNVITGVDPKTGAKQIDPSLMPGDGQTVTTCPHAGGAKNWLPDSYNPDSHVLFVSLVEACMDLMPVAPGGRGSLSTGVRWTLRPRPDSDGKYGRVQAINLETKKTLWMARQRAPQSTGVLATAGGVVFAGAHRPRVLGLRRRDRAGAVAHATERRAELGADQLPGQRPAVHRAGDRQRRRAGGDVPCARARDQESARSWRDALGVRTAEAVILRR